MFKRHPFTLAAIACVAAPALFAGPASAADKVSGDPGFGQQFLRNHPYTLTSAVNQRLSDYSDENASFSDLGLNTAIMWFRNDNPLGGSRYAHDHGLGSFVTEEPGGLSKQAFDLISQTPGNLGFFVSDEPSYDDFADVGNEIQNLRAQHPDNLYLSNAFPSYASHKQLYGQPNPQYNYNQYLSDFTRIIKPDVLMYDHYPFLSNGSTRASYFSDLMSVRSHAQDAGIPYWGWLQGFKRNGLRTPSESDIRMQAFTMQTAGYTGLSYFFYNLTTASTGLVERDATGNPQPTVIYQRAQQVNPELLNLGKALRFLKSTGVRFVAGQDVSGQTHSAPAGLTGFTQGAGGDPHIRSIHVEDDGSGKDGMVGLFTDDDGQHYFMLTNLLHGGALTPELGEVDFKIVFDSGVDNLLRLNRLTGEQEVVTLSDHTLNLTLPGGTGDLFKYNTGDFPVPEPASAAVLLTGAGLVMSRRQR